MREGNEEETRVDGERSKEVEKCEKSVEQCGECEKGRIMIINNQPKICHIPSFDSILHHNSTCVKIFADFKQRS